MNRNAILDAPQSPGPMALGFVMNQPYFANADQLQVGCVARTNDTAPTSAAALITGLAMSAGVAVVRFHLIDISTGDLSREEYRFTTRLKPSEKRPYWCIDRGSLQLVP